MCVHDDDPDSLAALVAVLSVDVLLRAPATTGSRHTTRPAHAGVGGHHTTVSPQFFIAYPQTRVPAPSVLGPYAGATGVRPNPVLDCSNPASLDPRTRTQYLQIWTPMSFSDNDIGFRFRHMSSARSTSDCRGPATHKSSGKGRAGETWQGRPTWQLSSP